MSDKERTRNIRIKTGVVKRLAKEKVSYEKEAEIQVARIERITKEGADFYDIRKQNEVLDESRMMVPDTLNRLVVAWNDLTNVLEVNNDLKECDEYKQANLILEDTKEMVAS